MIPPQERFEALLRGETLGAPCTNKPCSGPKYNQQVIDREFADANENSLRQLREQLRLSAAYQKEEGNHGNERCAVRSQAAIPNDVLKSGLTHPYIGIAQSVSDCFQQP